jgi:hypothetical protein
MRQSMHTQHLGMKAMTDETDKRESATAPDTKPVSFIERLALGSTLQAQRAQGRRRLDRRRSEAGAGQRALIGRGAGAWLGEGRAAWLVFRFSPI